MTQCPAVCRAISSSLCDLRSSVRRPSRVRQTRSKLSMSTYRGRHDAAERQPPGGKRPEACPNPAIELEQKHIVILQRPKRHSIALNHAPGACAQLAKRHWSIETPTALATTPLLSSTIPPVLREISHGSIASYLSYTIQSMEIACRQLAITPGLTLASRGPVLIPVIASTRTQIAILQRCSQPTAYGHFVVPSPSRAADVSE